MFPRNSHEYSRSSRSCLQSRPKLGPAAAVWKVHLPQMLRMNAFSPVFVFAFRRFQGYFGECGLRGGYMEVHGIGAEVSFDMGSPVR